MFHHFPIKSKAWRICCLWGVVFFGACVRNPSPVDQDVSGRFPVQVDSVRVKLSLIRIRPDGDDEEFRAVLWAVPAKRYRMEINGPLGMSIASLLWKADEWLLNLNTQDKYIRGFGHIVRAPGVPLPDLSIHELFAPFWGQMLPDGFAEATPRDCANLRCLNWNDRNGRHVRAEVDPKNPAMPKRIAIDDLMVEYRNLVWRDSLIIPEQVDFFRGGERFFTVRVQEVRRRAPWSSAIWNLKPLGAPVQP